MAEIETSVDGEHKLRSTVEEDTESTDVVRFFYEQLDFISKRNSRERARKLDIVFDGRYPGKVPGVRILVRSGRDPRI